VSFRASADVYDRHVGRYAPQLSAAVIDAAGVHRSDRVLDVGCGPGGLTQALAELVGSEAVAAVDPSDTFVAACRRRVPGADVRLARAEELPFEDDTFDVVLSQLVVNFLDDPSTGLREMLRVVRPDGFVAGCVWDYADGMTMLRVFWDAALALDPDAPDEGRTMRFCTPHELRELWARQLDTVEVRELIVHADYDDFDDFWSPFPEGIAPSGAYCASLDAERQENLRRECSRRLGDPRAPFTLSARAWFARGRASR
jgi:ubiquinone/menaquinone biosynthesis C-methylase UbiE